MPKRVLDVFERVAPIWAVKIPGQTIETTAEHPFGVYGRGWIPAKMLEVGDLLLTNEGLLVTVEGVEDTGRVETVYNFLVEDFHTYFVSATQEGASVSAHNSYTALSNAGLSKSEAKRANMLYKTKGADAARKYLKEGLGYSGSKLGNLMKAAAKARTGRPRGPNKTSGHTDKILEQANQLEAAGNTILNGGGKAKEATIPTPGGVKSKRRPDILYETPSKERRGVNVGLQKGGNPIRREQKALDDLNGPGKLPTVFVPYN